MEKLTEAIISTPALSISVASVWISATSEPGSRQRQNAASNLTPPTRYLQVPGWVCTVWSWSPSYPTLYFKTMCLIMIQHLMYSLLYCNRHDGQTTQIWQANALLFIFDLSFVHVCLNILWFKKDMIHFVLLSNLGRNLKPSLSCGPHRIKACGPWVWHLGLVVHFLLFKNMSLPHRLLLTIFICKVFFFLNVSDSFVCDRMNKHLVFFLQAPWVLYSLRRNGLKSLQLVIPIPLDLTEVLLRFFFWYFFHAVNTFLYTLTYTSLLSVKVLSHIQSVAAQHLQYLPSTWRHRLSAAASHRVPFPPSQGYQSVLLLFATGGKMGEAGRWSLLL